MLADFRHEYRDIMALVRGKWPGPKTWGSGHREWQYHVFCMTGQSILNGVNDARGVTKQVGVVGHRYDRSQRFVVAGAVPK